MKKTNNSTLLRKLFLTFASGFFFSASVVVADTLATYDFNDNTGSATTVATNVIGGDASWTGFVTGVGFGGTLNSAFAQTSQLSDSFNAGEYLSFTLTADSGFALNLESFSFDLGGNRNSGSNSYTVDASLRTDAELTPFSTDLTLTPGDVTTASTTFNSSTPTYQTFTADLSDSIYQGLDSITFNIYVSRTSGPSSSIFLRADSLDVQGAVIPEPATAGFVIGAMGLLFCIWRKRIKS